MNKETIEGIKEFNKLKRKYPNCTCTLGNTCEGCLAKFGETNQYKKIRLKREESNN